jgi:putative heme-binding domain-containing protein
MTQSSKITVFTALLWVFALHVIAAAPRLPSNASDVPDPDPNNELNGFKIADGFEIKLFAADPMIEKPIQMNWDAKGRMWCATSQTYPQLVPGQVPNDKVVILEDTTGSGKADKSTVFADGLFLDNSVIPGDGGAYVTNSTEILHLKDTKGTGKADSRTVVLSGFGTEDTHHIVHTLRWGPDGRLYFFQSIYIHSHLETPRGLRTLLGSGAWRFDTRTLDLDVYTRGLVNPWGIVWDRWGQTFETDGAGGEGINYAFPGVGFTSSVGYERVMQGLNPGSPKYASEELLNGTSIPDDYQGDILTNDFRANRIVRFKLSESGAGYTSKQMPDFLTCTDRAFRPVDIKMGPDGAIYIADWYNPIIQHGEVDFRDPRRDHVHGRIWRVTAKGRPPVERPQIDGAAIPDLLNLLKSPEDWTRAQAKLALRERNPAEVVTALKTWLRRLKPNDPQADHDRLEALWTCENVNSVDPQLLARVLKSDDPHARAAGVRVVGQWAAQLDDPTALLEPMVQDDFPRVRLEAVRALAEIPTPRSIIIATRVLDKPMDPFIDYALWLTCNELEPTWMPAFQSGKLSDWEKSSHLTFALRAVKSTAALKTLVEQLKNGQAPPDARPGMISLIASIGGPPEANALFDIALDSSMKDSATRAELLDGLRDLATKQHATPDRPERLETLAADADESVRAAVLRLVGAWKLAGLGPQLVQNAEASTSSDAVRIAAIDGLTGLGDPESITELRKLSFAPTPAATQRLALGGLAAVDLKAAAKRGAEMLAAGDPEPGAILSAFLSREGGAKTLAGALKAKKLSSDTAKLALRYLRGTTTVDPNLTDVLSAAAGTASGPIRLAPDQMKQTIDEVLAKGNAANGERIFRRSDTSCYQCHSIDGAGGWLAPDISSIGASSPVDYLINSVLDPNKDIKDGYDGYTVVTKSGDVFSGIKVSQDKQQVVLRDNAHLEIPIAVTEIKAQKAIGSLMPNGLTDTLTHQEFLDLIKFLSELGKPGPYAPTAAQYIRRWRIVEPLPAELASSQEPSFALIDGKNWPPAYSLVSGGLPVSEIAAKGKPIGYARGEINVATAGKIRLAFNDVTGLAAWIDDRKIDLSGGATVELTSGIHTLTVRMDTTKHGDEGLRVEVADVPGSAGRAQPVGGK